MFNDIDLLFLPFENRFCIHTDGILTFVIYIYNSHIWEMRMQYAIFFSESMYTTPGSSSAVNGSIIVSHHMQQVEFMGDVDVDRRKAVITLPCLTQITELTLHTPATADVVNLFIEVHSLRQGTKINLYTTSASLSAVLGSITVSQDLQKVEFMGEVGVDLMKAVLMLPYLSQLMSIISHPSSSIIIDQEEQAVDVTGEIPAAVMKSVLMLPCLSQLRSLRSPKSAPISINQNKRAVDVMGEIIPGGTKAVLTLPMLSNLKRVMLPQSSSITIRPDENKDIVELRGQVFMCWMICLNCTKDKMVLAEDSIIMDDSDLSISYVSEQTNTQCLSQYIFFK